ERPELRARIEKRLRERLDAGLVEEVGTLIKSGVARDRFALFGMEYKHAARYIFGEAPYEEMAARLLQDIYRLAKRQDTWFRGMERRGMTLRRIPRGEFNAAAEAARAAFYRFFYAGLDASGAGVKAVMFFFKITIVERC
ncbi:MAG: hypothetical protein LBH93_01750, partial [Chitinispirillales bacterium]|nr:hypothetical protein [Chitinispirillales bacterium]